MERAEIALGAKLCRIGISTSGLRVTFLAFAFALGFELRVLLLGQDSFCVLHVFGLARFGATGLLMLGHSCIHLCLLRACTVSLASLNLTPDQKTKIDGAMAEHQKAGCSEASEAKYMQDAKAVLTKEQYAKFKAECKGKGEKGNTQT